MNDTPHIIQGAEAKPARSAPGRNVSHPARFGSAAWRQILGRVYANVFLHHLSVVAAGVAFFGVLSIVPGLAALVGLYGLIADPSNMMVTFEQASGLLPPDAYGLIKSQLQALVAVPQQQLGVASLVAILVALWTARASVSTLVEGLNIVYREMDTRNIFLGFFASLALTALALLIGCVALLAIVALPAVLQLLNFGALGTRLLALAPLLVLGLAVVFVIGALFRYGPHRETPRKRWVTLGAILATITWVLASYLLSIYISSFANFNKTYGSLGAVAGLMFWFYVSAFVVLLGAELNAEMELQTSRDTTTGTPKPVGERGAYVADHVA